MNYNIKSPVLFLIFNRPDFTSKVFEQIKKAKPTRLYISADGAREGKENEEALCLETRKVVEDIDWDCEVKTFFRDKNAGCKYAISSAITWFFENEVEGIILEDDCVPSMDFFIFCDTLLEKYRFDSRIRHIGGSNLQHENKRGDDSYYFSKLSHVWGWATWKRAWKDYDVELLKYKDLNVENSFKSVFNDDYVVHKWMAIYDRLLANEVDTWDYQWAITNFFNNGLSVIPNINLISNIGFGENATHTFDQNDHFSNLPIGALTTLTHPAIIIADTVADRFTLEKEFPKRQIKKSKIKRIMKFWKYYKLVNRE